MRARNSLFFVFVLLPLGIACKSRQYHDADVKIRQGTKVAEGSFVDNVTTFLRAPNLGTGVWLHKRVLLTAGHVARGGSAVEVSAVGQSITALPADIVRHPEYQDVNGNEASRNDLSLLFFAEDNDLKQTARILMDRRLLSPGKQVVVAGYGAWTMGGGERKELREVSMNVVPWNIPGEVRLEHKDNDGGACNGDSGGPVFVKLGQEFLLAGINAYGDCNEGVLSAYESSRVFALDWRCLETSWIHDRQGRSCRRCRQNEYGRPGRLQAAGQPSRA